MNEVQRPTPVTHTLYTQADITSRCRLSRTHLYNLIARGHFPKPVLRIGTRFTRWSAAEVDAWATDPQRWIATQQAQKVEV